MGFKRFISRTVLKAQKYSPEILLITGTVTAVASTIVACRATLHADEVLDEHAANMEKIKKAEVIEANDETKDKEIAIENSKRDTAIVYGKTIGGFIKLYAPAAALGALSLACFFSSYGIMKKRNVALTAAYTALDGLYKRYRANVREELGEDADRRFAYGVKKVTHGYEEEDENGKKVPVTEEIDVTDFDDEHSIYAKWFDESSPYWEKSGDHNLMFIRAQEKIFNEILHCKGHVFLNEVYDALGIPRTSAGAVVGWIDGLGDNYIDFGLYNVNRGTRDFLNGYNRSILLDFNVDGVIYDKI